jgi:large subunit ribosomal protein L29
MRVDELRVLEADELGVRMRTARRELYELRFKHAVGQLDNSSQIKKVRHDIARIMTVLHERDFGIQPTVEEVSSPLGGEVKAKAAGGAATAVAEPEETPEEEAPKAKPKRGRGKKKEEAAE